MSKIGKDVEQARKLLMQNELVGIPTETVYGLAANGLSADAVLKIYEAKNRPSFNPLILHVGNIANAKKLVLDFPEKAKALAEAFWPGPLTLVLKKASIVPDIVSAGLDSIGIRIPNHPLSIELLGLLDFPLAAPSANPSGYVSPTTAEHVLQQLGDKVAYILDGGKCEVGIESTIIKIEQDEATVLRLGGIELEKIREVIGEVKLAGKSSAIQAPGMMSSHYAPEKKIILGNISENLKKYPLDKIGILSFKTSFENIPSERQFILSPSEDLKEAARNLFSYLRKLDESDVEIILTEQVPEEGLGKAINDRLRRAALG